MQLEKIIDDLNKKYNEEIQNMKQRESNLTLEELEEFAEIEYPEGKSDRYISYFSLTIAFVSLMISVLSIVDMPNWLIISCGVVMLVFLLSIMIFSLMSIRYREKLKGIKKAVFIKNIMSKKNTNKKEIDEK